MAIRHQLTDADTLKYLAQLYLNDESRWQDIVDYNNLVYPYLSTDNNDKLTVYANGYVHVKRTVSTQPITIKAGWTLKTGRNIMSASTKTYIVVNTLTLGVGVSEGYLYVRAIVPGTQGNTSQSTITELGAEFIANSITNITVNNDAPIVNGVEGFVRTTGEYIYIPTNTDTQVMQDHGVGFSFDEMAYFYGSDLAMASSDLIIDLTNGDLQVVSGVSNIQQAVNRRLTTEKGDMQSDFTFGNGVMDIIGDNALPLDARQKLVEVEILDALNYEDRIDSPVVNSITVDPSTMSCTVDVSMTVTKLGSTITLTNTDIGGDS